MVQTPVQKNQDLTVEIEDLTYEGLGVAKVDGYPLFIDNALPGERSEIHVIKTLKQFGFARVTKRLTTSPDRVETVGREYTQTGIAPLHHLAYPAQLTFKENQIRQLYKKAHLNIEVLPSLGMADPLGYRNKAQIPVREINGRLETGFYKKRTHDLIPIEDFYIQDPEIDRAILVVRDLLRQYHIPAYNEADNSGLIRHIMVRRGYYSHEMMVVLVTRAWALPYEEEIITGITSALPEVTSIVQDYNPKATNVILGPKTKTLYGKDYLTDHLLGSEFHISALSFYQVNPTQTEVLYTRAVEEAGLTGNEVVIDAYSGIGTISLTMARHAKQVYGVEIVPQAVEDARENAKINGIKNVDFTVGKAEEVMQQWKDAGLKADVLMVDPPRKGLDEAFIDAAGYMKPKKIVYVSCNPATLARDINRLGAFGYQAHTTQPVDMFPQTQHIESITVLTR
ncbi:23S rRNA (uracil(1939)-C(5))-methyltransferase RlmD [Lacticaseibacillus brantae]|uniref:tRNA (Uracil-5-)-methyltransferase n=1 Tax=Lacticaseibacillus brantae DSM 23927 TaxID=1423727 RepID=A0A0R2BA81_9LACO|nr:23S rRNA (uracil(1939)-C(5))-methyltransferase RlmD [Lacticaseibacillus brantae]KRM73078.1 tRNA (uracil-5-)-methyltransferase [Lacticaseibacillus brantae DSM 23927]